MFSFTCVRRCILIYMYIYSYTVIHGNEVEYHFYFLSPELTCFNPVEPGEGRWQRLGCKLLKTDCPISIFIIFTKYVAHLMYILCIHTYIMYYIYMHILYIYMHIHICVYICIVAFSMVILK